jgi:hypothetical protein
MTALSHEDQHTTQEQHSLALVGAVLQRIDDLTGRVADLEAWLGEVAEDMLDRTEAP